MATLALEIVARNQAQAALNQLKGGIADVGRQAQSVSDKMRSMGSSLQGIGSKMTAGLTLPILGGAAAALKLAGDFEQTQIALTTMLGDAGKAEALFDEMREFSASTPFEFPQIAEAGKMLLAFGIDSEKVIPKLKSLGDIASGVGIPVSDLTLIYGQASVAGRVMTGDLNQLVGRGVPILSALAKVMGVNEAQVRKLAEEGKVSFADFDKAITGLTENGGQFAGMMDAQSQSLLGLFSTFKDNITLTLADVGKVLMETFDLKGALTGLNEFLGGVSEKISNFAQNNPGMFKFVAIVAALAAAAGPLAVGLGWVMTQMAALGPVVTALGGAFTVLTGPVGLFVAAIGALVYFDVGGIRSNFMSLIGTFQEYMITVEDAGFGSIETQEMIGLFPSVLQGPIRFIDQTIGAWQNYLVMVEDAGYGSIEAQEAISLFPPSLQGVIGFIDQSVGAWQNYLVMVEDAGFGSIETQEAISLFPVPLQGVASFLDQTIGAFQNYTVMVEDAGYGSIEAQEAISLFPASLQGIAGFLDQTIGAFQWYSESVRDAGFGSIEAQESISLFPTSLQGVMTFMDQATAALITFQGALGAFASGGDMAAFQTAVTTTFADVSKAIADYFSGDISLGGLSQVVTDGMAKIGEAVSALFGGQDFAAFLGTIQWSEIVAKWDNWTTVILPLAWSEFLVAMQNWGVYIASLDWTAFVVQLLDWATWIPALTWNSLVAVLDWATYIASLDWNMSVPSLDWSTVITTLSSWGTYIKNLPWKEFVTATLEWSAYVGALTWAAFVSKLNWPSEATTFAWSSWLSKLNWPDLSFKWGDFVPRVRWPDLSFSWSDFVPQVEIPEFPGWGSLWNYLTGGEDTATERNAIGTMNWKGGPTMVGETGPEIIIPPRGSRILSNRESMVFAGDGGGITVNVTATLADALDINQLAYQIADIISRRQGRR